jgi:protein-tyrosine phosphatase
MSKQVLFVCSGNYYRSRFAEIVFNYLAARAGLPWSAVSRGLVVGASDNPGPISQATLDGLVARNIPASPLRFPLQLNAGDLARADRVIALYKREHLPMMRDLFPDAGRIEYWNVPDLGEMSADSALTLIEQQVRTLLAELAAPLLFVPLSPSKERIP